MLMGNLAYFAPDDIPLSLITAEVMNEIARGDAVAALYEVSLLEIENEGDETTVSVHRLAQTVMRDRLAKQEKAEEVAALALTLVADAFPRGEIGPDDVRSWPVCAALRPHVLSVLQTDYGPVSEKNGRLINQLAVYLLARAEHTEAEPLLRRAVRVAEKALGFNHPNVAATLNNLASFLLDIGRPAEAEPLMRRALAIDEQSLGPDHPRVAVYLNNLAALLEEWCGRYEEAERLKRRSLDIDERSLGPEHPNVAIRLSNLAHNLQITDRLAASEPLMRRALEIDLKNFGPDHPRVARDLSNLATLLTPTGWRMLRR